MGGNELTALCKCSPVAILRHLRGSRQTQSILLSVSRTAAGAQMGTVARLSGAHMLGPASRHWINHLVLTIGSSTTSRATAQPTPTPRLEISVSSANWASRATHAAIGYARTQPTVKTVASACTRPSVSSVAAFWIQRVACAVPKAVAHVVVRKIRARGSLQQTLVSRACPVALLKSAVWT